MKNLITLLVSLLIIYSTTAATISGTKKLYIYSTKKIEKIIGKSLHGKKQYINLAALKKNTYEKINGIQLDSLQDIF